MTINIDMAKNMGTIQKNIYALMWIERLNQPSFAKRIGKTTGAVNHWLKNDSKPSTNTIQEICEIFNVTIDDLTSECDGLYNKINGKYENSRDICLVNKLNDARKEEENLVTQLEQRLNNIINELKEYGYIVCPSEISKDFSSGRYVIDGEVSVHRI